MPLENSIVVIKHQRLLQLKIGDKIIKTYTIALGKEPIGAKEFEGDGKTPEGEYQIYHKSAHSNFYKSLGISYPTEVQKTFAQKNGKLAGGQIRIHGFKNDFMGDQAEEKKRDWTEGCIGVTNAEMDEIFEWVEVGIKIHILP
jgi:murein L,D-transpeptidase YafK